MSNAPLKLSKDDAYKIKVEEAKYLAVSPFKDVYSQAIRAFGEIHKDNTRPVKDKQGKKPVFELNPVIGFCGERGSGKTSAMVSFRNLLGVWPNVNDPKEAFWADLGNLDDHVKFLCLETVDPSRFEPHDRLIGSILGELYRRFDEHLKECKGQSDQTQQRKVEEAFKQALEVVQLLSNDKAHPFGTPGAGENPFEILKRAGKAADARAVVHNLVRELLAFLLEGEGRRYMVIPVDDLDMSVQHAYVLAEDIRKYFMIPNVVILLAAKVDQLRMAVEQSYVERFKDYRRELEKPSQEEIESMSNLYLEKLMPLIRRINLPEPLKLEGFVKRKFDWKGQSNIEGELEEEVLQLIYRKTLVRFLPSKKQMHPIIPKTLREFHNFMAFLDSLPDPEHHEIFENLNRFKTYFITEWVPRHLTRGRESEVLQIVNAPLFEKLRVAFLLIKSHFTVETPSILETPLRVVTLGTIRSVLDELVGLNYADYALYAFAIRTTFSIGIIEILFASHFDGEDFGLITNGAFTDPVSAIIPPRAICDLGNLAFVGNSLFGRVMLTRKILFSKSNGNNEANSTNLPQIEKSVPTHILDSFKNHEQLNLIGSVTYLGKYNPKKVFEEYEGSPWYDYMEVLDNTNPSESISFDFEAMFFWLVASKHNIDRFTANSSEAPEYEFQKIDQKRWATILQLEPYDRLRNILRGKYIRKRKTRYFKSKTDSGGSTATFRFKKTFEFWCDEINSYFGDDDNKALGIEIPKELTDFLGERDLLSNWFGELDEALELSCGQIRANIESEALSKSQDYKKAFNSLSNKKYTDIIAEARRYKTLLNNEELSTELEEILSEFESKPSSKVIDKVALTKKIIQIIEKGTREANAENVE